ncbi:MAG: hypothetical protein E6J79_09605 [Deltaproteobacteria bacterium]|nr:MAG: hypothetical protein E6J79_09605 [Deltaproteobacteria bacterium]
MDAIELIKKDHRRVEALFARFKGGGGLTGLVRRVTGSVPPRQRNSAVESICRELDVHTRIEEEILYPAARITEDADVQKLVEESLREHARVKEHVVWLRQHPAEQHPADQDVDDRMGALEQDVQHHVSEEENDMLPRLEQLLSEVVRGALGRRMQARKKELGATRAAPARATARKRRTTTARKATARKTARGARKTVARQTSRRKKAHAR